METMKNTNDEFQYHYRPNTLKKAVFGIMVMLAGSLLLAKTLGYLPENIASLIFSWQMLLVALGITGLFGRGWFGGLAMMVVGFYFMPLETVGIDIQVKNLILPIALIIVGILMIIFRSRAMHHPSCKRPSRRSEVSIQDSSEYFEDFAIFGGAKHQVNSENFKNGSLLAIFGGAEIDMSNSKMNSSGFAGLKMICVFGGASITVPEDWDVQIKAISILGGFGDKRRYQPKVGDNKKVLVIEGIAIMGGAEIKNI